MDEQAAGEQRPEGEPAVTETYPAYQVPPPGGLPGSLPPRQPPRRHDGNRPGPSRALWILLPLLLLGAAAAVLLTHPFSQGAQHPVAQAGTGAASAGAAAGGGTTPASPAVSGSPAAASPAPSASAGTERQAASSVAGMLAQSVSDRSAIGAAAADVAGCGPDLARD